MTDASVAMTGGPDASGQGAGGAAAGQGSGGAAGTRGTGAPPAAGTPEAGAVLSTAETAQRGGERQQDSAWAVAEAWLSELADQVSVPASQVQDRLLDLWGYLEEGPARVEVERWLTETLRRNLYSVSDINDRLGSLLPTS